MGAISIFINLFIKASNLIMIYIQNITAVFDSINMDYEVFLREHVVKGEWRFERTFGRQEGRMFITILRFFFILLISVLWESFVPPSYFWMLLLPLYINWIAYLGWDFLKPWKSSICLAVIITVPYRLSSANIIRLNFF